MNPCPARLSLRDAPLARRSVKTRHCGQRNLLEPAQPAACDLSQRHRVEIMPLAAPVALGGDQFGCLEHGEEFAREFIQSTFKWSPFWLNEREMARRPWLYQEQYMKIDKLLAELVPDYFRFRKLESEYATLLLNPLREEKERRRER